MTAKLIIIIFVGRMNSISGVIITSMVYYSFGEFFRFIDVWRDVLLAVVVVVVVIFRPGGIFKSWELAPGKLLASIKKRF